MTASSKLDKFAQERAEERWPTLVFNWHMRTTMTNIPCVCRRLIVQFLMNEDLIEKLTTRRLVPLL